MLYGLTSLADAFDRLTETRMKALHDPLTKEITGALLQIIRVEIQRRMGEARRE